MECNIDYLFCLVDEITFLNVLKKVKVFMYFMVI